MRSLFALSACVLSAAVELRLDGVPVLKAPGLAEEFKAQRSLQYPWKDFSAAYVQKALSSAL